MFHLAQIGQALACDSGVIEKDNYGAYWIKDYKLVLIKTCPAR